MEQLRVSENDAYYPVVFETYCEEPLIEEAVERLSSNYCSTNDSPNSPSSTERKRLGPNHVLASTWAKIRKEHTSGFNIAPLPTDMDGNAIRQGDMVVFDECLPSGTNYVIAVVTKVSEGTLFFRQVKCTYEEVGDSINSCQRIKPDEHLQTEPYECKASLKRGVSASPGYYRWKQTEWYLRKYDPSRTYSNDTYY